MHKYLGIILLGAIFASPVSAEEYQSVRCSSKADAQAILSIFMKAPSLQYGKTDATKAKLEPMLKTGACSVATFAAELTQYATTLHPEGGVRFGIVQRDEEHLLVFRFVSDGGGGGGENTSTSD